MQEIATVLFTREDIRRRVQELGRAITEDYSGRAPVLVCVLKGSYMFLADLVREIALPVATEFMSISSYGGASESLGRVRIIKDLDRDVGGEDVLLVEDIVDTGLTLSYLISALEARGPSSVAVCALLDKTARRIAPIEVRYSGFECPDVYVVGYGLDHAERYRNLRDILAVRDVADLAADPDSLLPWLLDGSPDVEERSPDP